MQIRYQPPFSLNGASNTPTDVSQPWRVTWDANVEAPGVTPLKPNLRSYRIFDKMLVLPL